MLDNKTKYCSPECYNVMQKKWSKEWIKNNKEKDREMKRKYRLKNIEYIRERDREYNKKNKIKRNNYAKFYDYKRRGKIFPILVPMIYPKTKKKEYAKSNKSRNLAIYVYKTFKIDKFCVICNSKDEPKRNYQIHHEIYPMTRKETIKAIIERKIYTLCIGCHNKLHSGVIFFDKTNNDNFNYIEKLTVPVGHRFLQ